MHGKGLYEGETDILNKANDQYGSWLRVETLRMVETVDKICIQIFQQKKNEVPSQGTNDRAPPRREELEGVSEMGGKSENLLNKNSEEMEYFLGQAAIAPNMEALGA